MQPDFYSVRLCQYVTPIQRWFYIDLLSGLSKAETQALTNYGSGEDENEEEEIEFEEGPVDVQTSLQASSETTTENELVYQSCKHRTNLCQCIAFQTNICI